jgi:hypothetical protein
MGNLNINVRDFFNKTNENHLFGMGGLIWNKTIGKIISLVERLLYKPITPPAQTSPAQVPVITSIISGQLEFPIQGFIQHISRQYNIDDDTGTLSHDMVEDGFKADIIRQTYDFKSRNSSFGILATESKENALKLVKNFLVENMPPNATEEQKYQLLNCLQQTLLLVLKDKIQHHIFQKVSDQTYLADSKEAGTVSHSNDKDGHISLCFTNNEIKLVGHAYFRIWTPAGSGKKTLGYIRATIDVSIPKDNFDKATCVCTIQDVGENLSDVSLTSATARWVAANTLSLNV